MVTKTPDVPPDPPRRLTPVGQKRRLDIIHAIHKLYSGDTERRRRLVAMGWGQR